MIKTGKEIKISSFKDYNIILGSINNKHPKAVYLNITSWVEPKDEDETNFNRLVRNLNKKIKQKLFKYFDEETILLFDKNKTIVDLDIRESGLKVGKRSFMSCEITLFTASDMILNSDEIKDKLLEITNIIINDIFYENNDFEFNKRKK